MPLFAWHNERDMSLTIAVLALSCASGMNVVQSDLPPLPTFKREFRAVWVATVDNIDWPSKRGIPTAQAKSELLKILDKAKEMNLNAVIFQVRPSADALYDSKLEPWSEYLTGAQGQAPKPYWDPLQFAVEEAHKRGIELHCWFNPYRALHPAQKGPVAANHISRTNPSVVKSYGKYLWMDPGEPAVQKRSLDVMLDVVKRYDVDGVHIDDYFYPYKEKGPDGKLMEFPDEPSFSRLSRKGSSTSRGDWRRHNVDSFIEALYKEIKQTKRWVKFGISPFGIYRPGYPEGIKAGVDQYADLYADALKWYQKGWCDYFTPQLYWPIKQTAQAYPTLLNWWVKENTAKRHLWPGNFTGRTSPSEGNWPAQEVVDQVEITRDTPGATGNVHFSMKAFMGDFNGVATALEKGPYKDLALIPASPWLGDKKPGKPSLVKTAVDNGWTVQWKASKDAQFYAVSVFDGKTWQLQSVTPATAVTTTGPVAVAITPVSHTGITGDSLILERP